MSEQSTGNYSYCCRLCLVDNYEALRPVFDEASGDPTLVSKILAFVGVKVRFTVVS